jgi:Kef-type K+ transport system membrane component KefB
LPIITGLLFIGILAGPFVLRLLPTEAIPQLNFLNQISLAFIAFAAGAELYLKDLNNRLKSIKWMTFGQLFFTFTLGGLSVWFLSNQIGFMRDLDWQIRLAIALLAGTIFVSRSPVSAIAVINEMRAKGPFTQTVLGVTVLKDVLVIILFTLCFAVSDALVNKMPFEVWLVFILVLELSLSFLLGFLLGQLLKGLLSLRMSIRIKSLLVLAIGYSIYLLAHWVHDTSLEFLGFDIYIEPLLICIIGSFIVVNFSSYRRDFLKIVEEVVPVIYIIFYTLTGASIKLDILVYTWGIALLFFFIRLASIAIGAYIGGTLGGDPIEYNRISWMPFVTQAGVALGLVSVVAAKYPDWGARICYHFDRSNYYK